MIENLRLDSTPELTIANTNSPSLPLNNSWYYKNQQGTLTTSNHLSATSDPTQTTPTDTAWCQTDSADCDNQSMLATNNTTLAGTTENSMTTPTNANVYSYGNYYNWYSATAGNGTYSKSSGSTSGDLCPSGWQLPIGAQSTADKRFGALSVALGGPANGATADSSSTPTGAEMSKVFRSYPNNFLYSGHVYGSSVNFRGSYGRYWSSTASSSSYAYNLNFASSAVYPGTDVSSKYGGRTVRCLAQ